MEGFAGILTVAFIVLKLTGFITWSWVWVLAPAWIGVAIALILFCVAGILLALSKRA